MVARTRHGSAASGTRLAVRIHDSAAALAVGIALLKGSKESGWSELNANPDHTIAVFEQVLAELRQLSRTLSNERAARTRPAGIRDSLEGAAKSAGIGLELRVTGDVHWLTEGQAELVRFVGREAIRNVKRHSGANRCRISIDVSSCPFVLTARDWGAGIQGGGPRSGRGIAMLEDLAGELGAVLNVSSQPGLGMQLTLVGPRCVLTRTADQLNRQQVELRSVVADESLGSRKRVAARRPIGRLEQQIT
jgi:signal transduction histidine kinase